jgi:hypothetical protein
LVYARPLGVLSLQVLMIFKGAANPVLRTKESIKATRSFMRAIGKVWMLAKAKSDQRLQKRVFSCLYIRSICLRKHRKQLP